MSRTKTVLEYVGAVAIGLLSLAAFGAVLGLGKHRPMGVAQS